MLSPSQYYPEDDFDVDIGLDLDQFEYDRPPQRRNRERFHDFEPVPYDEYGDRHGPNRGGYYDPEPAYAEEYSDNIVMKARPEYNDIPGRPFEPREYYRGDMHDDIGRHSVRHPQPRYYREPRMQEEPHYSYRDYDFYSRSNHHDAHGSRDHRDTHMSTGRRDFYRSARYRKPSSNYMEDDHEPAWSFKPAPSDASPSKPSGSLQRKHSSNTKEQIRKFPAPDSKLPAIPPPDYDGADAGVKYVPQPDY